MKRFRFIRLAALVLTLKFIPSHEKTKNFQFDYYANLMRSITSFYRIAVEYSKCLKIHFNKLFPLNSCLTNLH